MVGIKVSICLFVIAFGAALVDSSNWKPFAPYGFLGISFFGRAITGTSTSSSLPPSGQASTHEGHAVGMLAGSAIVFFSSSHAL